MSHESFENTLLKQRISELQSAMNMARSQHLNDLIDLKVMIESDETDEALDFLAERIGPELDGSEEGDQ